MTQAGVCVGYKCFSSQRETLLDVGPVALAASEGCFLPSTARGRGAPGYSLGCWLCIQLQPQGDGFWYPIVTVLFPQPPQTFAPGRFDAFGRQRV